MDSKLSASEVAKRKLIVSAIYLFAEQGVSNVSLRMINREAGHKNNSALHYHFGNKMGLVAAVDDFIQANFDDVREAALSDLETKSALGEASLADALRVFVLPYVAIIENHEWGLAAVRSIVRMEFDENPEVQSLLNGSAGKTIKRFARVMRPMLPDLTAKQFKQRFNFVVNATCHGFAEHKSHERSYLGNVSFKDLNSLAAFHAEMGIAVFDGE